MADRLEAMEILIHAVDAGSLSAAAEVLGMPLATVSRRVADLERHLGIKIFTRSPKGLSLTEPGEAYVSACRSILERVNEAEQVASGEYSVPKGVLSLSAPIVFGRLHVLPIIKSFMRAYPEVSIRFEQTDRPVSLLEEPLDVVVRIGHLPDSSLRACRVGQVSTVVCASPEYIKSRGRPLHPEELAGHDCITFTRLMSDERWEFADALNQRLVPVKSRIVVNTAEAAIDAAIAGLGVTRVLSYQAAAAVAANQLSIILADYEPIPMPVNILYPAGVIPQKTRVFIDFTAPLLKRQLLDICL